MAVGGAYDFDGEKLRTVTGGIDASAEQGCSDARTLLLQRVNMKSLAQALR